MFSKPNKVSLLLNVTQRWLKTENNKLMWNGFVREVQCTVNTSHCFLQGSFKFECLVFLLLAGNPPPSLTRSEVFLTRRKYTTYFIYLLSNTDFSEVSHNCPSCLGPNLATHSCIAPFTSLAPVSKILLRPIFRKPQANRLNNTIWVFVLLSAWFTCLSEPHILGMIPSGSVVPFLKFQIVEILILLKA